MDFDKNQTPVGISTSRYLLHHAYSFFDSAHTLKLCGLPGEVCICNGAEEHEEVLALSKSRGDVPWENATPTQSMLNCRGYRPLDSAARVECPVLFIAAEKDYITPPGLIEEAARRAPRSELFLVRGARHAEPYFAPFLNDLADRTTAFFLEHLAPRERNSAVA